MSSLSLEDVTLGDLRQRRQQLEADMLARAAYCECSNPEACDENGGCEVYGWLQIALAHIEEEMARRQHGLAG